LPQTSAEKRTYSHSRLSCFEKCPKAFHYRYVLEIPPDTEGIEAFMGKRVHAVLERLFRHVEKGHLPSLDAVLKRFHNDWDEAFRPDFIRIARNGTPVTFYRENGEKCLRHYYRRHAPFNQSQTLGLEEKISFGLDPDGQYFIQGFIDRLAQAPDGTVEIHDYKTGARPASQREVDNDRQLSLYEIGVREQFGVKGEIRLVWHFVQKDVVLTSSRTLSQLEKVRDDTLALIERIESEKVYPAKLGPLCNWCEYLERCPAKGGSDS